MNNDIAAAVERLGRDLQGATSFEEAKALIERLAGLVADNPTYNAILVPLSALLSAKPEDRALAAIDLGRALLETLGTGLRDLDSALSSSPGRAVGAQLFKEAAPAFEKVTTLLPMLGLSIDEAFTRGVGRIVEASNEMKAAEHQWGRAFILERAPELRATGLEVRTPEDEDDLFRRLLERLAAPPPEPGQDETIDAAASTNPLLPAAIEKLWAFVERWAGAEGIEIPQGRAFAMLGKLPLRPPMTLELLSLEWRVLAAFEWPEVYRGWAKDNAPRLAAQSFLAKLAQGKKPDPLATDAEAAGRLELALRLVLPEARRQVPEVPPLELPKQPIRNGMVALDADLVHFVANLPDEGAKATAEEMRRAFRKTPGWLPWADPLKLPRTLARALWKLRVRPALEQAHTPGAAPAKPFALRRVIAHTGGGDFTPLDLSMSACAGLFSGAVEYGKETYALQPGAAPEAARVLQPRAVGVVPSEWLEGPRQVVMAGCFQDPWEKVAAGADSESLIVDLARTAANMGRVPALVPKVLVTMFAATPFDGAPTKGTLGDLLDLVRPDSQGRKRRPKDLAEVGAAVAFTKNLRLLEKTERATLHPLELFVVDYEWSATEDTPIGWCANPFIAERMKGGKGGGFFPVNYSRLMALKVNNPRLFALYLRLAGMWNLARWHGVFRPERFKPLEVDRLAFLTNTLPLAAAECIAGKRSDQTAKVSRSRARSNVVADLEELRAAGLCGDLNLSTPNRGNPLVRPMPDGDLLEAYRLSLKKGASKARGGK
jgi:hypothetical protein